MKELREKLMYQETLDLDDGDTRSILIDLVDKDTAMKPIHDQRYPEMGCPICGDLASGWEKQPNYCHYCGQKLDWED